MYNNHNYLLHVLVRAIPEKIPEGERRQFIFIPPANFVCGGYTVFTLSVRACVHPCVCASVRL